MALPNFNQQTFELNVPSTDEKIKYRPFLVKEEKILLQAQESSDNLQLANALKTVINNCTFNAIDIENYPSFDLEYIFLNIRAKSVGEIAELKVRCPDDNETFAEVKIDLTKINVEVDIGHTNKIEITDTSGVIMTYPTMETLLSSNFETPTPDDMLKIIAQCILQVYDGDTVYDKADTTDEERKEFLENLTQEQFKKLQDFFTSMPKLKHTVNVTNPKTKKKGKVTLEGLRSFF